MIMQRGQLYRALDVCIQSMHAGLDLDRVLDLYPKWRSQLAPLIRSAYLAYQLGENTNCPQEDLERERQRFLHLSQTIVPERQASSRVNQRQGRLAVLILVGVIILLFVGSVFLTQKALPGSVFYGLKETGRDIRLAFVQDSREYIQIILLLDQRRLDEIQLLIQNRREAPVSFGGRINLGENGKWQIDGVRLISNHETQLVGDIWPGFYVRVEGILLRDGTLLAKRIRSQQFLIRGTVETFTPERMVVDGFEILFVPDTLVQGDLRAGARVEVMMLLADEGLYRARLIKIMEGTNPIP
jgi:hypothetical protein